MRQIGLALVCVLSIFGLLATAADDAPIFSDSFATLQAGWGKADELTRVQDGHLIIRPLPNKFRLTLYRDQKFQDIDLRVQIVQSQGNPNEVGGVTFWGVDFANYYTAMITLEGKVLLGRFVDGELLQLIPLTANSAVKKGLNQPNNLRVVTSGDSATVFINDQQVFQFKGMPPLDGSLIGFHAESGNVESQWEISQLVVHKGPASPNRRPTEPSIVYADDFSTFEPAWGVPSEVKSVQDGKLKFDLAPKNSTLTICQGGLFGDMDLRLSVTAERGGADCLGGVVFWAENHQNYYVARIRPNGIFAIGRMTNGEYLNPVAPQTRNELQQGVGKSNELRVVTSGRTATIYLNGQAVTSFKGFPPQGGSKIGVSAYSGTTAATLAFSNLTVRRGSPSPENKQDGSVLFADDFTSFDPGWGEPDEFYRISDGKMFVTLKEELARTSLYQGRLFDDADIQVKVTETQGSTDSTAGILFWAIDGNNFCVVTVNADGGAVFRRKVDGKWQGAVSKGAKADGKKSLGKVHQMRVVTTGNTATMYVNGDRVASFESKTIFPPKAGGRIGLYATSGKDSTVWKFTDFVVQKVAK